MKAVIPTITALLVFLACLGLAVWQLERAEYKDQLLAAFSEAGTIALDAVDEDTPRYAQVEGSGQFLIDRDVLLDNQVHQMQPGVHVFTPFRRASDGRIFMVNRGWQPGGSGPLAETPWLTPAEPIEITGLINDPPRVGVQLGSAEPLDPDHWPNLMTYYDRELIDQVLDGPVDHRVILLDAGHEAGFSGRDWQPVVFGPERHRGYAFQWFMLAAAVFVIWLVLFIRYLRPR